MAKPDKGVWFVRFPTYQYVEDAQALAKSAGLRIIDARFDNGEGVKDAPKLTLKSEVATVESPAEAASDDVNLVSVYKLTDGVRGERASKAGVTAEDAAAWIADHPDNTYETVAE